VPGDDVQPVVDVDQRDEADERGELLLVVVLGGVRPDFVADAAGRVAGSAELVRTPPAELMYFPNLAMTPVPV
jgi:hypothetical protein